MDVDKYFIAKNLYEDLWGLKAIKKTLDRDYWAGIVRADDVDTAIRFQSSFMNKALKKFVNENIEKLTEEFEKI